MRSSRSFLLFTMLIILIGILNYLGRKKIPYDFGDILSYNRLYSVKEQLRIRHIAKSGQDSLSIVFDGLPVKRRNHFEVFAGGIRIADQWGPFLTIKPFRGSRTYNIRINSLDSLIMNIDFPPGDILIQATTSSILMEPGELPGYADWITEDLPKNTASEDRETDGYLRDSMKILPTDNSEEKVIKISKYILSVTEGKRGMPSDTMHSLRAVAQLNCVRNGKSLLYCGNYGYIFASFANRAGVPARYIECGVADDGVANGGHVFNEVYLRESSRWAFVDLMEENVFVRKNGRFLNTVDIQRLLRYDDPDTGFAALHYVNGGLISIPFRDASLNTKNYFNGSNVFHFYYRWYNNTIISPANLWERMRNFLSVRPYYAIYSDNISTPNYAFYLRICSNYLLFAGLLCWAFLAMRYGIHMMSRK